MFFHNCCNWTVFQHVDKLISEYERIVNILERQAFLVEAIACTIEKVEE